ncbi:hypothetical protein [Nocardioides sp. LML1-1-1.1]|uniref:hypothetical protein n=1 Tax=Nocardioides sp. LML1-1-1.1 TaxID=3135248 RepID=UPI003429452A
MTDEHDTDISTELAARAPRDAKGTPDAAAAPHPPVEDDLNITEENADGPDPARTDDDTA